LKLRPEDVTTAVIVIAVLLLLMLLSACVAVSQQCSAEAVVGDTSCTNSADDGRRQLKAVVAIPAGPSLP
jgi:hypothetical protein